MARQYPDYTDNLGLKLPRGSKYWNYDTWNDNMKILDEHSYGLTTPTIVLPMPAADVRFVPNQDTITATNVQDGIDQLAQAISIVKHVEIATDTTITVSETGHEYYMLHFGISTPTVTFVARNGGTIAWLNGSPTFQPYTTYEISFLRLKGIWSKRSDIDYRPYFTYTIADDVCYVTGVDVDAWYNDFNNYDIYLPVELDGHPTVIKIQ
jgi:hypothetical protein